MQRVRALGVAGCLAMACEDAHLADVFLDRRLAVMRPLSAAVHGGVVRISGAGTAFAPEGLERVWGRLLPHYFDLARRTAGLDRDGLLVLHSVHAALSAGVLLAPKLFAQHWRDLWRDAGRRGLLANPHVRMQLAILGSHVGQTGPHVDWLCDARVHAFDLADTLCFVRRDTSEEILDQTAASIRGEPVDSERWTSALANAPTASWLRLAEYVRACTRFSGHISNEGQALMVLSWVEDIAQRRLILQQGDGSDEAVRQLCRALRRIESVQTLSKSRFHRVIKRLRAGPVRDRLVYLWYDSYTPPSTPEANGFDGSGESDAV